MQQEIPVSGYTVCTCVLDTNIEKYNNLIGTKSSISNKIHPGFPQSMSIIPLLRAGLAQCNRRHDCLTPRHERQCQRPRRNPETPHRVQNSHLTPDRPKWQTEAAEDRRETLTWKLKEPCGPTVQDYFHKPRHIPVRCLGRTQLVRPPAFRHNFRPFRNVSLFDVQYLCIICMTREKCRLSDIADSRHLRFSCALCIVVVPEDHEYQGEKKGL